MKRDFLKAAMTNETFMLHPSVLNSLTALVNSTDETILDGDSEANNSVITSIIENVGVVEVHGAMYKKKSSGFCMSVLSYGDIFDSINMMENDNTLDTILVVADTPGGVVASGADRVADLILNSTKRVVLLGDNTLTSGGMWCFTATKERYATNLTQIGSVGVKGGYFKKTDNGDIVELVSANAENKDCNLNGTCEQKVQATLNTIEDEFYKRLEKNTGFNKTYFIENFNKGDVIFADKALEIGFIDGITTKDELLKTLVKGAVPAETKPANKFNTRTGIMADEANVATAEQAIATERKRTTDISALGSKYGVSAEMVQTAIADGTEMVAFKDTVISALSTKIADLEVKLTTAVEVAASSEGEATKVLKNADTTKAVVTAAQNTKV